jgi:hypothetical protein
VDLKRYQTFAEATANVSVFIEDVYNAKQLHVSLGYRLRADVEEYYAVEVRS